MTNPTPARAVGRFRNGWAMDAVVPKDLDQAACDRVFIRESYEFERDTPLTRKSTAAQASPWAAALMTKTLTFHGKRI